MCPQLVVAKTAVGARNIGQAPTQMAIPSAKMTRPRYIGLRVSRNGPVMTSLRLVGDVGSISVPSRRKRTKAHTGSTKAATTKAMPSGANGKPGSLGQANNQLIAALTT